MSQVASSNDKNCTFLISTEKASSISQDEVCKMIEDQILNRNYRLESGYHWYARGSYAACS